MLLLRRVIFFTLLAVFLAGAPWLVMYALGYIYRPGVDQEFVKTGLIYLSTAPSHAAIYVGKRRYREKTPAVIRDLVAGDYDIRILHKGYVPWTQTVPVEGGKSTAFEKILLRPENPKTRTLVPVAFQNLTAVPETPYFLVGMTDRLADLRVYDREKDRTKPIAFPEALKEDKPARIFTAAGSPYLLMEVEAREGLRYLWTDLEEEAPAAEDLTPLILEKPDQVHWDKDAPRHLFSLSGGVLNRTDREKGIVMPSLTERARGFGIFKKDLYLLHESGAFLKTDFKGQNRKALLRDSELFQSLFGGETLFGVHVLDEDLILFLDARGRLLCNRLPYELAAKGVLGFDYYKKDKKIMVWTEDAVGVVHFEERPRDEIFELGPKILWVHTGGAKIRRAFWVYEGAYALFQDKNRVFMIELETFGEPGIYPVAEARAGSDVAYSEKTGLLYYLEKDTGHLGEIEIVPTADIIPLPFPEKEAEEKKGKASETSRGGP